jgi:hypothetical protein
VPEFKPHHHKRQKRKEKEIIFAGERLSGLGFIY